MLCCTSPGGTHPSYPLHELPAEYDDDDVRARGCGSPIAAGIPTPTSRSPASAPFYEQMAAEARRPLPPEAATGLRRQLMARAGHDVVDALGSIDAPTLVCAGRYDDLAPLDNSEFLAERIPGARLEVFDGGHIFMIQDRTAFPTIIRFLADAPT